MEPDIPRASKMTDTNTVMIADRSDDKASIPLLGRRDMAPPMAGATNNIIKIYSGFNLASYSPT